MNILCFGPRRKRPFWAVLTELGLIVSAGGNDRFLRKDDRDFGKYDRV